MERVKLLIMKHFEEILVGIIFVVAFVEHTLLKKSL
jgi:hypothetical protein